MSNSIPILEVCAGSEQSARAALAGGAQRIELCSALEIGGITPSLGLLRSVRAVEGLKLHVLIRSRGGDFLYTDDEVKVMETDIRMARDEGADGVVIGALLPDGNIDEATVARWVKAADGMNVTFHRAFDVAANPSNSLERIINLGCNRLLTSGQAASAMQGLDLIASLQQQAADRIIIMPGCGVNSQNAAEILRHTRTNEIHASARSRCLSGMQFRASGVSMGNTTDDAFDRYETDINEVMRIVKSIKTGSLN
ncbi:MAG: copper homeostasis protein CutC [Bacteroidaceae bacterium]|nr:copper homeostasis protein CutC [Bacteroidaceae bacterium]